MRTILALALLAPTTALAVPLEFSHQGRLMDALGTPLDGAHDVDFALYNDPTGGVAVWTQSESLDFDQGYFHTRFTSLDTAAFDGSVLYLGLAVDSGAELPTRVALVSVPYAFHADGATTVTGGGVVNATEIQIDGTTVIDSSGNVTAPADWSSLNGKPADFADDIDNDAVGSLGCSLAGDVAVYDGSAWTCGTPDVDAANVVTGTLSVARLPVGSGALEVAAGDHIHGFGQITGQVAFGQMPTGPGSSEVATGDHGHTAADVGAVPAATGGNIGGDIAVTGEGSFTSSVQVGDNAAACGVGLEGTIRWDGGDLRVCNGSEWMFINVSGIDDGSSPANAAQTCDTLLTQHPGTASGVYWIDPLSSGSPVEAYCEMTLSSGGWTIFARVHEENDSLRYGFDAQDNGWANTADTFISIVGWSFDEMIFVRRDTGAFYDVTLPGTETWPAFGSHANVGNGYTVAVNPDNPPNVIRAYDADAGKAFQLCFFDAHNDECGPTSAGDPNNYGDAGGNDGQNMLWAGSEVNAIGTGIVWDFGIK